MSLPLADPSSNVRSLQGLVATFTAFDWFIVVVAVWSTIRGLVRGLLRELFALAAVFLGLLAAAWYYAPVAASLSRWITQPAWNQVVAFLLLLVVILAIVTLAGRLVRSAAHMVGLGLLDRLAGAVFGLLRASLLGAALLIAWTTFLPPQPAIRDSRLAPLLSAVARSVTLLTPGDLHDRFVAASTRLRRVSPAFP